MWAPSGSLEPSAAGAAHFLIRPREAFADRSVLVSTHDPFAAALALIELDGVARRLIVCTPDLTPERRAAIAARAEADASVTDFDVCIGGLPATAASGASGVEPRTTEWLLLTSGTTGVPRIVRHTLATLAAAIAAPPVSASTIVWGTFYDIRRFGGLQILLRSLVAGGSFVMSGAGESVGRYLERLAEHGATHVSGTPSHWRRVLMSPGAAAIAPRYVRLSGEIADQPLLDALRARYPDAHVAHVFASTEAGVVFDVNDGVAGFPVSFAPAVGNVCIDVSTGSLRVRSNRTSFGYLGEAGPCLIDPDGFVDTGDLVERRGARYHFLGRRTGVINVGGLKVHPEEVEAAINRHPSVRMSRVRSTPNPITGAVVTADVVLYGAANAKSAHDILQACRDRLPPHKIPATIRIVPALEIAPAGKLARDGT